MTFTCDVEVHDAEAGMTFRLVADPESNEPFGLSCAITQDGRTSSKAHVSQLDLKGDYIRALVMLGRDFLAPCVGIFVPTTSDDPPTIGRWRTGFESAGYKLDGLNTRQGMKLMEEASQSGAYATQPALGSFTRPDQLLGARPISLVHRRFTA